MKAIKFRQRLKPEMDKAGEKYHYWGYLDGGFVCPVGKNIAYEGSEQYTGYWDHLGFEIYE